MTQFEDTPYDVLVIGAGAAGVTLARKLAAAGMFVGLAEGGEYTLTPESQALYETINTGHTYSTTSTRMRMFGGGTNCWGGYVCRLDPDTFQARNDLHRNYPGWPIALSELEPYFEEALKIVDIPPDAPFRPQQPNNPYDRFNNMMRDMEMYELYWNLSPPTRFVLKYRDEVEQMERVDVLLDHSLADLIIDADGRVTDAVFQRMNGERFRRQAKRYILACGGIENARLLMYINAKHGTQYGNISGMLGKHFMEHPELDGAQFVMTDTSYQHRVHRHAYRFFRPTRDWQLRDHFAACILRLSFTYDAESEAIVDELANVSRLSPRPGWRAGYIMASWEQLPSTESYIELSSERDGLGLPRAVLHWQLLPEDYDGPRRVLRRFAEAMARYDMGRVRLFDWILDETAQPDPLWAKHHIGTTRMARNEREGCTDTSCRLFGTQNLYLAGASLFPTTGYENPTVPLIQLSLRLADHLIEAPA